MKRFLFILCFFPAALALQAQDADNKDAAAPATTAAATTPAATPGQDEINDRFNRLQGQVDDMLRSQAALDKALERIKNLEEEVAALREQQAHPNTSGLATQEDWKRLKDKITEVDENRVKDFDRFKKELTEELGRMMNATTPPPPSGNTTARGAGADITPERTAPARDGAPEHDENGYYYVIKKNDLISTIAAAYREQGIKVTTKKILDANAGLNPNRLIVGQKIFIPAPADAPKPK